VKPLVKSAGEISDKDLYIFSYFFDRALDAKLIGKNINFSQSVQLSIKMGKILWTLNLMVIFLNMISHVHVVACGFQNKIHLLLI